ncbi:hypothetical protein ACSBR1_001979 [Camellia fascicularis]
MSGGERKRSVKLLCPSLSKKAVVPFVVWDDERLDLGSIARTFGLDPWTLKLNGHFVSRGVDLIALSVTWKSLLSFFSSRGLSTGATDSDPLIVHGHLSKLPTKRAHDPADVENGICYAIEHQSSRVNTRPQLEDTIFLNKKRRKESCSGNIDWDNEINKCDGFGLKRKQCSEDVSPLKRIRMIGSNSGTYRVRVCIFDLFLVSHHLISLFQVQKHCFWSFADLAGSQLFDVSNN